MPLAKSMKEEECNCQARLRQKMKLKEGDEFVSEDLGEDTIVLKKINLRALLEDAIVYVFSWPASRLAFGDYSTHSVPMLPVSS